MGRTTFGVEKDHDGVVRQKFMQGVWKPAQLKKHLDQPSQLKTIKQRYDIIIVEEEDLQPCVLRCKGCSKLVSLTQPHQSTKQHNNTCKSPPAVDELVVLDEDEVEQHAGKRKRAQSSVSCYMPSAQLQEKVRVPSCVPSSPETFPSSS